MVDLCLLDQKIQTMEKATSFERVVGKLSAAEKQGILNQSAEMFAEQDFDDLEGLELSKTSEELRIISLVNEVSNARRRKYGLSDFDIPPKNIHIIEHEAWDIEETDAYHTPVLQSIALREQPAKMVFAKKLLHEMVHFKAYGSVQATSGREPKLEEYRNGLCVASRDGHRMYLRSLDEAVTEEMVIRDCSTLFEDPIFAQDVNQTKAVISSHPDALADSGDPLFNEDTFYALESIHDEESDGLEPVGSTEVTRIVIENFNYEEERKLLSTLMDKLLEKNRDKFQSLGEIFEVFARALMTGNILPLGRVVDGTFGHGTLRSIGELDHDISAQAGFVNSL